MSKTFSYYKLQLKLTSPMLGTCTEGNIYQQHILAKAKKLIAQANKLSGKVSKTLAKYKGEQISPEKELLELTGIINAYAAMTGKKHLPPTTIEEALEVSAEIEAEFNEMVEAGEEARATVFMRDSLGVPVISTHMLKGQFKEVSKTVTNAGDKSIFKSKTQVNESLALDLSFVEPIAVASKDIERNEDGTRKLNIRPIRFTTPMGQTQTAIAQSECLPIGTEFGCTLRVRKNSPIDKEEVLKRVFDHGKALGLGAWRSSGGMGQFKFKLEKLENFSEPEVDDWL